MDGQTHSLSEPQSAGACILFPLHKATWCTNLVNWKQYKDNICNVWLINFVFLEMYWIHSKSEACNTFQKHWDGSCLPLPPFPLTAASKPLGTEDSKCWTSESRVLSFMQHQLLNCLGSQMSYVVFQLMNLTTSLLVTDWTFEDARFIPSHDAITCFQFILLNGVLAFFNFPRLFLPDSFLKGVNGKKFGNQAFRVYVSKTTTMFIYLNITNIMSLFCFQLNIFLK